MGVKKLIDHYANLGIARDATPDQIKRAWSKFQSIYHPDKNQGSSDALVKLAEEKLKEINAAKEVLLDPEKRAELDQLLEESERGSAPAKPAFVPEFIDFGRIKAGETRHVHLDIQNLGGPPINRPELDSSPDSAWFDVTLAASSDSDRFWFGLEVTVINNANAGATVAGQRTGWISVSVDGATKRATVSAFFEQRPDKATSSPITDAKSAGPSAARGSGAASVVRPAGTTGTSRGDADTGSLGPARSSKPRWGMIGAALGLVAIVAIFGVFDPKARSVVGSGSYAPTNGTTQPQQSLCSVEKDTPSPTASPSPPQPFYDWHRCPGEGCSYPQGLVSTADMAVRTKPDMASAASFTVERGTRLIADDGVNVTTAPGRLVLLAPIQIGTEWARVGDTVFEYTGYGEGYALTWFRGQFFSCQTAVFPIDRLAKRQQEAVYWQWHKVRDATGRTGWIRDFGWGANGQISGDTERLAGGGESSGCGQVPTDFFAGGVTACLHGVRRPDAPL